MKIFFRKIQIIFDIENCQNFAIFDNFYLKRLKNFLRGWLLILGLKEGLVECVTVSVKSEVILA
jgi:hypothetical protein